MQSCHRLYSKVYRLIDLNELSSTGRQDINTSRIFKIEFNGSLNDLRDILHHIVKNTIHDYIIAEDLESNNTLVFLKDEDLEQLGIEICTFCDMLLIASMNDIFIKKYIMCFKITILK